MAGNDTRLIKAAFAFVRDAEGRILLVCNNYGHQGVRWGVPGGTMEEGEAPLDCVIREAREEVGLELDIGRDLGVIERHAPERNFQLYAHFFEAAIKSGQPRIRHDDDHVIDWRWAARGEVASFPGVLMGRWRMLEYLDRPETFPQHIVLRQGEE